MPMFTARMGSWAIKSMTDPRWISTGRGVGLCSLGGPPEMYEAINRLKETLGEPPADLTTEFLKD